VVTYRALTPLDIEPVADFAMEGLPRSESLRASREKVLAVVAHFETGADFHLIALAGGRVVGAVAAVVSEMLFFERCEAVVVMFQARGVPGVGRELLHRLRAWADADMRVRRVVLPEEVGARRGFERLLRGCGFEMTQRVSVFQKG
jgi:hypothetical protein